MKAIVRFVLGALGIEVRRRRRMDLPVLYECECDGVRFPFWIANVHAATWWMKSMVRFDAEMQFLKKCCREGAVVLEVGAHHGMHTIQMARWVGPHGQVHAFELNAENALTLAANVGSNRLDRVHVVHAAVGGADGLVAADGERVIAGEGRVRSLTLDRYCAERGIHAIDVLKIDVEGYEGSVLAGARRLLDSRPEIDLELHLDDLQRYGDAPGRVLGAIAIEDYEVSMMVRPEWEKVTRLSSVEDLPSAGVVNLFCRPRDRALPVGRT